ncbi:hypothetical protein AXG93_4874s1190 [Marchantia polymorpha subsp. ruderalis]|uniref:RNA helicase n=1 Tax=Marchantia polymorpha subsp. ruderalis TaxID=1480154 RepID=A0A176WHX8_MARPO|nr:hypothetical protein AXG93_4874s1190 [Marchantia polymorpha subsp. ruderalis]
MAPKKQPQQQKGKKNAAGKAGEPATTKASKGAAQVHISSENERKLRQLLANTGGNQFPAAPSKQHEELSEGQKRQAGKRLRNIYDTLVSEGFSASQIEMGLGALPVGGATLEGALDWLCMNLPPDELPIKFSSGVRAADIEGGSIQVIAAARPDWTPTPVKEDDVDKPAQAVIKPVIKEKKPEKVVQAEQADWIKRYLAQQQEEDAEKSEGDSGGDSDWEVFADPNEQNRRKQKRQVVDPRTRALSLAQELQKAKQVAAMAKERRDKEKQAAAGRLIRELRQEMSALGLTEDVLNQTLAANSQKFSGLEESEFPSLGETKKVAGLKDSAFPSLGESKKIASSKEQAFPSLGETRKVAGLKESAFPSLGESKKAPRSKETAFPSLGASRRTSDDDTDQHSVGTSYAALLGKIYSNKKGGNSGGPNFVNLKPKQLPDWARAPVVEDVKQDTEVEVSETDEQVEELTDEQVEESKLPDQASASLGEIEDGLMEADSPGQISVVESEVKILEKVAEAEAKSTTKPVEPLDDEEGGILGMFDEEAAAEQTLPESVVAIQMAEKYTAWGLEKDSSKKKQIPLNRRASQLPTQEETLRQPKAVLQQHCQKNAWAAPKYEKLPAKGRLCAYTVTVTRPTDAQNAVATWALSILLPDLPLHRILPEPYRSMCLRWQTSGQDARNMELKGEEARRATFVDSLVQSSITREVTSKSSAADSQDDLTEVEEDNEAPAKPTTEGRKDSKSVSQKRSESLHLKKMMEDKLKSKNYKVMLDSRAALPMAMKKHQFLEKLKEHDVVVVSGETGCGKTTQVPQYILDEMIGAGQGGFCNIVCTQPRRIAAISVAERVAVERCEPPPGSSGSLVGYQVRLDTAWNAGTKLLFCTTGILLRRLAGDRELEGVSHIVVDEVHERTVLGDFLLVILKDLLERRRKAGGSPLKLILMSATLDSDLFSQYFGDCPVIKAKGRTFPVTTHYLEDVHDELEYSLSTDSPAAMHNDYKANKKKTTRNLVDSSRGRQNLVQSGWGDDSTLEETAVNPLYDRDLYSNYSEKCRANLASLNEDVIDYDLLEDLIIHINDEGEPGAILVFLPGMAEIQFLWDRLAVSRRFSGSASEWLLPLHSSVASSDQRRVFQTPPHGLRKVVLATNIAETSITIDDVVHVIDSGKHKENRFDPRRGMSSMVEAWISQANSKQRSGRAGRVRSGHCYCLFTRNRFEKLMRPFQLPEILRVPLVELCLQIKLLRLGRIASFLEQALEPPKAEAVLSAVDTLRQVGALDENENLTSLGYHLANLPVDCRVGKMMLFGAVLGCLGPVLTVAACLSHKSPFISPQDQREAAERAKQALVSDKGKDGGVGNIASGQQSDHLAMVAAYNGWSTLATLKGSRAARDFCSSNFLSGSTLNMLRLVGANQNPDRIFGRDMRNQFASLLADIGFIKVPQGERGKRGNFENLINDPNQLFNRNSTHASVVKAALCAGLYPNVAAMEEESVRAGHASALSRRAGLSSGARPRWNDGRREVFIHPTSINHSVAEFRQPFIVFHEKVETSRVYLRDTTVISPYALLLFGGAINVQHQTGRVTVDSWLEMNSPAQTAVLFKNLRAALDSLLDEHIKTPQGSISSRTSEVITSIAQLLIDEEKVPL